MPRPLPQLTAIVTAASVAVLSLLAVAAPASAEDTTAVDLLTRLRISAESGAGYDRALFQHWIDADGNGCDTREEVLIAESEVEASVGAGWCDVLAGQWTSWYDGAAWTDPSDVDIDHFVPLAEAWGSGANTWNTTQRRNFANDLTLPEALEAVTDNVNSSKSDSDPAEWLPPIPEVGCRYAVAWVKVKYRWSLSIDAAERNALSGQLGGSCGATVVTVPAVAVTAPQQASGSQLSAGAVLVAGTQLTSPNGKYRAAMQGDGNFVVYSPTRALWSSRSAGNPGARLTLQTDGNLVLYSTGNRALFHTGTAGRGATRLALQDDGNLVLYTAANRAVWFTGADRPPPPPPAPGPTGNTVNGGQTLASGKSISSSNGRYRLSMQTDGNLVVYSPTRALWSSRTSGPGARLVMQGDGNAVIYTTAGSARFSTGTSGQPGARLVIQDDGNLVVYAGSRPLWNTGAEVIAPPPGPGTPPPPPPSNCSSAYPDFCIPPPPRDLDCPEVRQLPGFRPGFTVLPPDPHRLDGSDNDGRGCE